MGYKIQKNIFWVHIRVLWSSFPLHWKPNILLVNYDSWWQHQMSVRELRHNRSSGRFLKSLGLSPSVSFLSSLPPPPLPALLLTPFFARSLILVPRSLLLNRTETLATQATCLVAFSAQHYTILYLVWGQQCFLMSERLLCSCDGFCGASEQEAGAHVTCRLADGNLERIRRLFSNL